MSGNRNKEIGLQLPFLEGISPIVPTKHEVEKAIGFGLMDALYERLLDVIISGDSRPWWEILASFREEDNQPDHPWSR